MGVPFRPLDRSTCFAPFRADVVEYFRRPRSHLRAQVVALSGGDLDRGRARVRLLALERESPGRGSGGGDRQRAASGVGRCVRRLAASSTQPPGTGYVIFVSSSGGASRAAYWTTSSLGKLEDEARSSSRTFADNIFVISGISGGSLGSAAFVTSLDLVRRSSSGPCSKVRDVANSFTGMDHLSTVVGLMLFPDLVQRFIPKAFDSLDRSRGLEEVWAHDWDDIVKKCGGAAATAPNPWERELTLLSPVPRPVRQQEPAYPRWHCLLRRLAPARLYCRTPSVCSVPTRTTYSTRGWKPSHSLSRRRSITAPAFPTSVLRAWLNSRRTAQPGIASEMEATSRRAAP